MHWMDSLYNIINHAGSNVHSLLLFGARKIGSTLEKSFFFNYQKRFLCKRLMRDRKDRHYYTECHGLEVVLWLHFIPKPVKSKKFNRLIVKLGGILSPPLSTLNLNIYLQKESKKLVSQK